MYVRTGNSYQVVHSNSEEIGPCNALCSLLSIPGYSLAFFMLTQVPVVIITRSI